MALENQVPDDQRGTQRAGSPEDHLSCAPPLSGFLQLFIPLSNIFCRRE